jgi:glycosyltransferase involved in cell wall biosynthesis
VGDAAVMVNPENVFEMMRALHCVLLDQSLRERLRQRGYEQVTKFSWDKSAEKVLAGYEEAAGNRRAPEQMDNVVNS